MHRNSKSKNLDNAANDDSIIDQLEDLFNNISTGTQNFAKAVNNTSNSGAIANNNIPTTSVENYVADETLSSLRAPSATILEEIAQIEKLSKEARNEITAAWKSGDQEQIKSAEAKYGAQANLLIQHLQEVKKARSKYIKDTAETEDSIRKQSAELQYMREHKAEIQEAKRTEFRLEQLNKVLKAEIEAEDTANNIDVLLGTISKKEGESDADFYKRQVEAQSEASKSVGKSMAEQANAEANLAAEKELEKQITELIAQLNAESMANNGGILTDDAATQNMAIVQKQFSNREERIADIKKQNTIATNDSKLVEANEKKKVLALAKLEAQEKKKLNRELTVQEKQALKDKVNEEYKLSSDNIKKLQKEQQKEQKKEQKEQHKEKVKAADSRINAAVSGPLDKENNLLARIGQLKDVAVDAGKNEDGETNVGKTVVACLLVATKALSNLMQQLESKIDSIASYKGDIDTRLQGSNNKKASGSYWDQLTKDMMSVGAVTPFFKQEDFANNIKTLVNQGISFDLKQRAFLMTIQEKIANTFNVADGTLLRLIRIQQEDSTAGRLGMESALNSFLNNMYETSEYLSNVASSVRSSLEEMESLMAGAEAAEVEYQVQKWMGSLYSVGMSQEAVQSIAAALGQIAAGQIEALTNNSGAGNLMVMAANEAGLNISDILIKGLDAKETNKLLQATVNYLAELAETSKDNKVVQQQLASVFGVKASDLKAATNLTTESKAGKDSVSDIFGKYMTYDNMLNQLNTMAGTMYQRTSIGEMMTNVWDNGQYTLASSMSSNPAAYLIYKMASLLDNTVGGIPLPFISAAGFGVDLETTVADLMRVASLSVGILDSLGPMVEGLSSSFSGQSMLRKMGVSAGSGLEVTPRGTGAGVGASDGGGSQSLSSSGYVGNASGSDIKDTTIQEAEDTKDQLMIEAMEDDIEHEQAHKIEMINSNVLKIFELLDGVASGKRQFTVKVAGYGLTSLDNNSLLSNAQGGVAGLHGTDSSSSDPLNGGFGTDSSSSTGNNFGHSTSTGIDLGGWTII